MENGTNSSKNDSFSKKSIIKILFYNTFWDYEHPDYSKFDIPNVVILTDINYIDEADVVIFHIPTLRLSYDEIISLKLERQLWVYWSYECEAHYPLFQGPEIKNLFDIKITYELDSDISIPYAILTNVRALRRKPLAKTEFINAFISSTMDKSGRFNYLTEMMAHIEVHSFGNVLNNRNLKNDGNFHFVKSNKRKLKEISKYKFSIAFENAIAKDYVTEKFFEPLQAGSVPVYLGAPNIDEFAPGSNCFINVSKFLSVKQLVDYLKLLDGNDELYNKYFEWKKLPFLNNFENIYSMGKGRNFIMELLSVIKAKTIEK